MDLALMAVVAVRPQADRLAGASRTNLRKDGGISAATEPLAGPMDLTLRADSERGRLG